MTHYRKALALIPTASPLHFALGRALYKERKDDEAVAELERARSWAGRRTRRRGSSSSRCRGSHRTDEANRPCARSTRRDGTPTRRASLR